MSIISACIRMHGKAHHACINMLSPLRMLGNITKSVWRRPVVRA